MYLPCNLLFTVYWIDVGKVYIVRSIAFEIVNIAEVCFRFERKK